MPVCFTHREVKGLRSSTHLYDYYSRYCNQVPDSLLNPLIIGTNVAAKVKWTDLESGTAGNSTTFRDTTLRAEGSRLLAVYVLKSELLPAEMRYC